jgi:hypothetical protein
MSVAILSDEEVLLLAGIVHSVRNDIRVTFGQEAFPDFNDLTGDNGWMSDSAIAGIKAISEDPNWTPEVEHERWYAEREKQGWRHPSAMGDPVKYPLDKRNDELKLNPAMVHYSDLPAFEKLKDSSAIAVVRAYLSFRASRSAQKP